MLKKIINIKEGMGLENEPDLFWILRFADDPNKEIQNLNSIISEFNIQNKDGIGVERNIEFIPYTKYRDGYILGNLSWEFENEAGLITKYWFMNNKAEIIGESEKGYERYYIKRSPWDVNYEPNKYMYKVADKQISIPELREIFPSIYEIFNKMYLVKKQKSELSRQQWLAQEAQELQESPLVENLLFDIREQGKNYYGKLDDIIWKIILALQKRNGKVEGIILKPIKGLEKRYWLSGIQGNINGNYFNISGFHSGYHHVQIPKIDLWTYDDFSGPSLRIYVGNNWESDMNDFYNSCSEKSGARKPMSAIYTGSIENDQLSQNRPENQLPPYLIHSIDEEKDYDLKFEGKEYFDTQEYLDGVADWLETNVLGYINRH